MINIYIENETACIYSISDWETLRKSYRIIGDPLGTNFCIPSLPVKLLPEEALILKRKGIVKFVTYDNQQLTDFTDDKQKTKIDEFMRKLCEAQKQIYREMRRKQLNENIEKIIEGKRKRGVSENRSTEEIFNEELEKSCVVTETSMLWPIFNQNGGESVVEVSEDVLRRQTSETKLGIYEDLWNRGYFVTVGNKFGTDFLIYLGDPILHHATHMIRCIEEPDKPFHPGELIAFGRLGVAVKKRPVLGTLKNGNVSYVTLNWND